MQTSQTSIKKLTKIATHTSEHAIYVAVTISIAILLLPVYWRDFEILLNEALNAEAFTYILILPLLIGYLCYKKKDIIKASLAIQKLQKETKKQYTNELIGLSLCITAFLTYWYGSYTFYPLQYHLISLPIFLAGIILILFNLKTLITLIPVIILLAFLTPMPNETMYAIGGIFANTNTQIVYNLLKPLGIPVELSATYGAPAITLATSAGEPASFTIDLPCSGVYTFIAFTLFATFLAFTITTSIPKKIMIFAIGFIIFELLNVLRITIIILAAYFLSVETAMLVFHTIAGIILTFLGMLITLIISEKILKIKFSDEYKSKSCAKCKTDKNKQTTFCLNCGRLLNPFKWKPNLRFWGKIALLLLGFSTLTLIINAPVFAIAKNQIEVESTWENIPNIFPEIPEYNLHFLYRDINYEKIAKQDASLTYAYFPQNITKPVVYVLVGIANSISNLHSWEVCLISLQTAHGQYPLVEVLDQKDVNLMPGSPIIARYLVFYNPSQNYTQNTLYWYEKATFKIGPTVQQKYVRINILILTRDSTNYQQYEPQLLAFGESIASYWQPIKTQSIVSLGIPAQQTLLILSIAFVIITKTTQYTSEWRKRTENLKIFNSSATPEDKLVLQTITKLSKEKRAVTTQEINFAIKRKIGKFMEAEKLVENLNRLQKYDFIKMDIISNNNKPFLTWKSLVNI